MRQAATGRAGDDGTPRLSLAVGTGPGVADGDLHAGLGDSFCGYGDEPFFDH